MGLEGVVAMAVALALLWALVFLVCGVVGIGEVRVLGVWAVERKERVGRGSWSAGLALLGLFTHRLA